MLVACGEGSALDADASTDAADAAAADAASADAATTGDSGASSLTTTLCEPDVSFSAHALLRGFDGPILSVSRVRSEGSIPAVMRELHSIRDDGTLHRLPSVAWNETGEIIHVLGELRYVRQRCRDWCSETKTLDGGQTWSPLVLPGATRALASFGTSLFSLVDDQLVVSHDVGESWEPVDTLPFATAGYAPLHVDDEGRPVVWTWGTDGRLARRELDGAWTVVAAPCEIASVVAAGGVLLMRCGGPDAEVFVFDDSLREPRALDGERFQGAFELRAFGGSAVFLDDAGPGTRVLEATEEPPYPVLATLPADGVWRTLSWRDRLHWVAESPSCPTGLVVGVLSR
jgi:hypothetical protein